MMFSSFSMMCGLKAPHPLPGDLRKCSHHTWPALKDAEMAIGLSRSTWWSSPTARQVRSHLETHKSSLERLSNTNTADDPESTIIAIAKRLDGVHAPLSQLGIQFIQVGNDERASNALRELDDTLVLDVARWPLNGRRAG
jgi:hypothetical protein